MILLLTIFIFFSPSETVIDSARVFRLNDVVVTGTRSAVKVQELPSPVQVMDSLALERMNGTSLADKLKQSAGLNIRSYGGSGSLQSVSVRGMGSDYSLILLNGVRYTTFQIGTVDLGIFSEHDVERIEIANGGSSALYGADAVGGVINIITRRPSSSPFVSLTHRFGSFGQSGYTAAAGSAFGDLSIRGAIDLQHADNDFEFLFSDGSTKQRLRRSGADYTSRTGSLSVQRIFTDAVISIVDLRYTDADRGQPSAVSGPVQVNTARIHDKDIVLLSSTELKFGPSGSFSIPVSFHYNRQTYSDPVVVTGGKPLDAVYENNIVSFGPQYRFAFSELHSVTAGSEIVKATITSNELIPSRREQYSGFIASQHRFPGTVELLVFPSVRYDAFSDVDGGLSTKIGLNAGVLNDPVLRFRGSIGRNYRVPTFNDLYWIDGGNPLLTPEHSVNGDAGVIVGVERDEFTADIDAGYFWIDARNKIVWRPGPNNRWSPQNIQSVSSSGVEIGLNVNVFRDLLFVKYHHTFLRTIQTSSDGPNDASYNKYLPFVPKQTAVISAGSSLGEFTVNFLYTFTGFRFETADNDPRYILPTVETVDANFSYHADLGVCSLRIKGEVNNMLNTNYQMITGYPLPLRNYALTTQLSL